MTTRRNSSLPASERMSALVPGWFRARDRAEHGLLCGLLEALGVGLDAARDDVLRLQDDLFIETCDAGLIPLIGDLVGASTDTSIPTTRQRHQTKYALHLRRRSGTVDQLQTLGWQLTGFRTRLDEAPMRAAAAEATLQTATVSGTDPSGSAQALSISGVVPPREIRFVLDVAWPVRRAQLELIPVGPDVHAVDSDGPVGLRRSDGTPIFVSDDPDALVGPGKAVELDLLGADLLQLGPLQPRFMHLGSEVPPYVPHRTLAIDPERGRVAGPTSPVAGIRAYRRYRMRFWEPTRAERATGTAAYRGDGVYTFASDGGSAPVTDVQGARLRVYSEADCAAPTVGADERLLVTWDPGDQRLLVCGYYT